jgi:hypothetical protein
MSIQAQYRPTLDELHNATISNKVCMASIDCRFKFTSSTKVEFNFNNVLLIIADDGPVNLNTCQRMSFKHHLLVILPIIKNETIDCCSLIYVRLMIILHVLFLVKQ